jgi:ketosteroid isomerase-like protein
MTTAEVVHAFLERLGTGDVQGVTELFADDIDWWAPGTVLPWAGRRSRRSEVPEFFRVLESACVPAETRVEVEKVLIDGEDAVVFGTYHRIFAQNGRSF